TDTSFDARRVRPLSSVSVTSASVKPRLAGQQPSSRGGVLRVTTGPSGNRRRPARRPRSARRLRSSPMPVSFRPGSTTLPHDVPLAPVAERQLIVPVVPDGQRSPVHLDYAASAPPLESVVRAVEEALPWYASVHRGAGFPSTVTSAAVAEARDLVARFVGARPDDLVVFTRNTTD